MSTKFIYVRDEKKFPLGCFAYRVVPVSQRGEVTGMTLKFGYSVFNLNDKFNRRDARVIAEYRLITDCRAAYATHHWDVGMLLAQVMGDTAATEIHQWAYDKSGDFQPLNRRFRQACARMARHLRRVQEDAKAKNELNRWIEKIHNERVA